MQRSSSVGSAHETKRAHAYHGGSESRADLRDCRYDSSIDQVLWVSITDSTIVLSVLQ
jgi:hypothetical protein